MKILQPKITTRSLLVTAMAVILWSSCQKDDYSKLKSPVWEPSLAFPLVFSELDINDLAHTNDSGIIITTDPERFATLIYKGNTLDMDASMVVHFPNQGFNNTFSLNSAQILALGNTGQLTISGTQFIDLAPGQSANLDSMLVNSGIGEVELQSNFPAKVEMDFTFPGVTKDNNTLEGSVETSQGNPSSANQSIDLAGYNMNMSEIGITGNKLRFHFTITISNVQNPITPSNEATFTFNFMDLKYEVVYGYFGQNSFLNPRDTISVSIFENSTGLGSFTVAEPEVTFTMQNSMGIPLRIEFPEALAQSSTNPNPITGIPNPVPSSYPDITQIGQVATSGFALNNSNSNIPTIISQQPQYLLTKSRMTTNPDGYVSTNFLTNTSSLALDINLELPLHGTAANFRVKDTLPFSYDDLSNVEQLQLRTEVENGFPIDAVIQIMFTDEFYNPIDSLYMTDEIIVPSGIIDPVTEKVITPGKKKANHIFDSGRITKLLRAKHIIVNGTASTFDDANTNVKIYTDYLLKVKVAAKAKVRIQ